MQECVLLPARKNYTSPLFPASIANWCLHVSHLLFETTFPMLHVHKTAVIPCRSPSLFHVFCSAILMISGSTKRITLWNNPWSTKRISGSEFHDLWIVYMISGLSHHFLDLTLKCFRNSSFDQLWSSSRVQKTVACEVVRSGGKGWWRWIWPTLCSSEALGCETVSVESRRPAASNDLRLDHRCYRKEMFYVHFFFLISKLLYFSVIL